MGIVASLLLLNLCQASVLVYLIFLVFSGSRAALYRCALFPLYVYSGNRLHLFALLVILDFFGYWRFPDEDGKREVATQLE